MQFLNKTIHWVFLIDFFTAEERQVNRITFSLCSFLNRNGIPAFSFYPNTIEELRNTFIDILDFQLGQGVIIHLIGHGDYAAVGFGNQNFHLTWEEVAGILTQINIASNDGLIVNSSIMCHGQNILRLLNENERPFYAVIGSTTERSLQALDHNQQIYNRCFNFDFAPIVLNTINNTVEMSQGIRPYLLRII